MDLPKKELAKEQKRANGLEKHLEETKSIANSQIIFMFSFLLQRHARMKSQRRTRAMSRSARYTSRSTT
jgi:hypothetical protein